MDSEFSSKLQSLIGIPFGRKKPPIEADCATLCIYAQKILFNKEIDMTDVKMSWDYDNLEDMSKTIIDNCMKKCKLLDEVELSTGDIITAQTLGFTHILTVVNSDKLLLHTGLRSVSRLSQYRRLNNAYYWRFY